jgi:hypothetical protein
MILFTYYTKSDRRCIVSRRKLVGLRVQYSTALRPPGVKLEVLDDTTPGACVLHLKSILSPNCLRRWLVPEEVASCHLATVETWRTELETGMLTENRLGLTSIFMTQSRFHPPWQSTMSSNFMACCRTCPKLLCHFDRKFSNP